MRQSLRSAVASFVPALSAIMIWVVLILVFFSAWSWAPPLAAAEPQPVRAGAGAYQARPALALPAGLKVQLIVRLRIEGDPIGNWLASRLAATSQGYCGSNGAFRIPWQLYQELLAHVAAPSRTDDDYPQARWEREQQVIELKGIELCRSAA
jgi:hypothetical protein